MRLLGEELRAAKADLGRLVTLEVGKVTSEGLGEVQEMIDICDYATGLSRPALGLTIATERPDHRMMETWHPAGHRCHLRLQFPGGGRSWNAALAFVCGDAVVWKPSEKTPLTAGGAGHLREGAARFGGVPEGLSTLLIGGKEVGEALVDDARVPVVSATGSTAMGRAVAPRLAGRFAKAILELGATMPPSSAPRRISIWRVRAIAFAAMGTAGQRCTTLRRLIVHETVYDALVSRLKPAYGSVKVGDPGAEGTLIGPLIDGGAFAAMQRALDAARAQGGTITGGERVAADLLPEAHYVRPALVEMPGQSAVVREETFAPILYVMRYSDFDAALALHNDVPQGCPPPSSPPTCARRSASCR